jgi:hypothetical protein
MLRLCCMLGLCGLALALWYIFPPASVIVILIIAGIASGDSDLLSIGPRQRHR